MLCLLKLLKGFGKCFCLLAGFYGLIPPLSCLCRIMLRFFIFCFQPEKQFFQLLQKALQVCRSQPFCRQKSLFPLVQLPGTLILLRNLGMSGLRPALCPQRFHFPLLLLFPLLQLLCNPLIQLRMKQTAEDGLLALRPCPQKLHKLSLGDHGHLHKLAFRDSHQLLQLFVSLLLGIFRSVRHTKAYLLMLLLRPASAL